jgi:hypothetical protein
MTFVKVRMNNDNFCRFQVEFSTEIQSSYRLGQKYKEKD